MRTVIVGLLAFMACGRSGPPDIGAWNADVDALRQTVTGYQERVSADASATSDSCASAREAYVTHARAYLSRLQQLSGSFDSCFEWMRAARDADVGGMCGSMSAEIDRYATNGCASSTADVNRADALSHCSLMFRYLDQAASRSATMGEMMGGSGMMRGCP